MDAANELSDMPAGKEKTDRITAPIGLATENDGKCVAMHTCSIMSVLWCSLTAVFFVLYSRADPPSSQ